MERKARRWQFIISYGFASLVLGLVSNITGASTSYIAELAGVSETELLPVIGGVGLCFLIGAVPGALLIDNPSLSHIVFGCSLVVQAVTLAIVPSCHSLICLTATFSVQALTFNVIAAGTIVLAMKLIPERQNIVVNIMCTATGLGSTLSPLVISIAVAAFSDAGVGYYLIAGVSGLVAVGSLLVGSPTDLPKEADTGLTCQRLKGYRWAILAPSLLNAFANLGVQGTYGTWVYTYARKDYNLSKGASGFVNASFWGAYTVGGIISTVLANTVSPEAVLYLMTPLAIAGPLIAVLAPHALRGLTALALCSMLVGVGNAGGLANSISLAARLLGRLDGVLTTLFGVAAGLGTVVLPVLFPPLSEPLGMGVLMWSTALLSAAQVGLVMVTLAVGKASQPPQLSSRESDKAELLDGSIDPWTHHTTSAAAFTLSDDEPPYHSAPRPASIEMERVDGKKAPAPAAPQPPAVEAATGRPGSGSVGAPQHRWAGDGSPGSGSGASQPLWAGGTSQQERPGSGSSASQLQWTGGASQQERPGTGSGASQQQRGRESPGRSGLGSGGPSQQTQQGDSQRTKGLGSLGKLLHGHHQQKREGRQPLLSGEDSLSGGMDDAEAGVQPGRGVGADAARP